MSDESIGKHKMKRGSAHLNPIQKSKRELRIRRAYRPVKNGRTEITELPAKSMNYLLDMNPVSDIPEFDWVSRWGRFDRPVTQWVTRRLNAKAAKELSKFKGTPYQTYIKQLRHDALIQGPGNLTIRSIASYPK